MKIALFGFSGSGKTALSAALSGKRKESFDPLRPVPVLARMSDRRLEELARLVPARKTTPPDATLLDFPGPPKGASPDERVFPLLGEADVICLVAGGFTDGAAPAGDLDSLVLELVFRDLQRLSGYREKRAREISAGRRRPAPGEDGFLERAVAWLEEEHPLCLRETPPAEKAFLDNLALVSARRMIGVVNGPRGAAAGAGGLPLVALDAARPEEARSAFWARVPALTGRITFYTLGEKENRGWLLPRGATALEAAGLVHSDLARGFVRAEVVSSDDFLRAGSWPACWAAGSARLEGRNYPVADGDVVHIRSGSGRK